MLSILHDFAKLPTCHESPFLAENSLCTGLTRRRPIFTSLSPACASSPAAGELLVISRMRSHVGSTLELLPPRGGVRASALSLLATLSSHHCTRYYGKAI